MTIRICHEITFTKPLVLATETAPRAALAEINTKLDTIMALLDDLQAKVERNTEVQASAVLLLQGLKAQLDAAGTDAGKLKELSDQLGANTDALAASVAANTPAAEE